jgi:hypothetical protein
MEMLIGPPNNTLFQFSETVEDAAANLWHDWQLSVHTSGTQFPARASPAYKRPFDSLGKLEARGGIEPPLKVLQTYALPLGYRAWLRTVARRAPPLPRFVISRGATYSAAGGIRCALCLPLRLGVRCRGEDAPQDGHETGQYQAAPKVSKDLFFEIRD